MIAGHGGERGPDLTHVARRLDRAQIESRIRGGSTNMPAYVMTLPHSEVDDLIDFLETRRSDARGRRNRRPYRDSILSVDLLFRLSVRPRRSLPDYRKSANDLTTTCQRPHASGTPTISQANPSRAVSDGSRAGSALGPARAAPVPGAVGTTAAPAPSFVVGL